MSVNNFFGEGSPYLGHPLLAAERTERELDEILALVGTFDVEVLDVGCGFGRHAVAMAARGARVTAIDPSGTMITAARERADATGQRVDFAQTDAVGLDAHDSFDLVTSLYELAALAEGAGFADVETRDRGLVEPPMTMMTMLAQRPGLP